MLLQSSFVYTHLWGLHWATACFWTRFVSVQNIISLFFCDGLILSYCHLFWSGDWTLVTDFLWRPVTVFSLHLSDHFQQPQPNDNMNNSLLQLFNIFPPGCSATIEENINITQTDIFKDMEPLPKKPEEPVTGPSTSSSECPSLPASHVTKEASSPASSTSLWQKLPASSATPVSLYIKKKSTEDHEKNRVGSTLRTFREI